MLNLGLRASYQIGRTKSRRAPLSQGTPGRPTPMRASETTTLHPPRLLVRCVGRARLWGLSVGSRPSNSKAQENYVLDTAAAPRRGRRGACSWVNLLTQPSMWILPARVSPCTVQGARVDLLCFVQRAHSHLSDARKCIGRLQSTRTTIFVFYRYISYAWSSSHTRLHVCLEDCAICDHVGVCV